MPKSFTRSKVSEYAVDILTDIRHSSFRRPMNEAKTYRIVELMVLRRISGLFLMLRVECTSYDTDIVECNGGWRTLCMYKILVKAGDFDS